MISLTVGGTTLTLHSGIFWTNEFSEPLVAEEEFADLDGSTVVQRTTLSGGRLIIWEAKGSERMARSYWTRSQIEQIEQWQLGGQTVTAVYGSKTLYVRVPANPFNVTPLKDVEGHTADDLYFGTITFSEVV